MTRAFSIWSLALVLAAQTGAVEMQLKSAIEDFEFGDHAAAAKKLSDLLNPLRLSSAEDVIVARQYLGACHYLLDERARAEAEFAKILALDPEHKLDPEVFSPALVQFFEDVRARTGLGLRKQPPPKEEKKDPPKIDVPPAVVAPPAPEPEKPPLALAFVPFGVGQFNNDHPVRGAIFGSVEVGLFATAIATFAMFSSIPHSEDAQGRLQYDNQEDADRASSLQAVYLGTLYAGLGVLAIGIAEALISYPGDAAVETAARTPASPFVVRF